MDKNKFQDIWNQEQRESLVAIQKEQRDEHQSLVPLSM